MIHRSRMSWPLTDLGRLMAPGDLIGEAMDAVSECNSLTEYPRLIVMPLPNAFAIDRDRGTISADCEWVWKRDLRAKGHQE